MKIRIAVSPSGGSFDQSRFAKWIRALEELRFDTVWLSDVPLGGSVEPLVGLSWAAGVTRRLKLGANIVPIGRNAVQLAKQMAQVDQLSAGRLLVTLVPGIGTPAEREALGVEGIDRGFLLERAMGELRRLFEEGPSRPLQQPLELWLGGSGPRALERAGRLGDGWLGAGLTPPEARKARETIEAAAAKAGRSIDPEHFGMSIAYGRSEPDEGLWEAIRARRPGSDPRATVPIGADALHRILDGYLEAGCSKFVLRPLGDLDEEAIAEELQFLSTEVLVRQT